MIGLTPRGRVYREILVELFRLRGAMLESSERIAATAGLTTARWQVLGSVTDTPATVARIARGLGLTRQAVQETADAMGRDGLIAFLDNPEHKRARLISPTPRGRKALDTLKPREARFANLMGSAHALNDLRSTLEVLRRSRATIEAQLEDLSA